MACGVLQCGESNARRSTQRKGLRRDEAQNCSVKTKLENTQAHPVDGFPERFQVSGRTFVDSSKPPDSDERWKVRQHGAFSIPHEAPGIRQTDQSCHNEVWLHLDFVEWRSAQSHHAKHDRRILFKERSALYHYGKQKGHISDVTSHHSLSS